jgi:serine/threonine protein kinase
MPKDKDCPKNKIRNPKTNKCVLKTGKIGKQIMGKDSKVKDKDCPKNKIRNPKTNKCVLKTGKIGKQILGKDSKVKDKDCPKNKIRNPKTNKCVLKTGKIGKQILSDMIVNNLEIKQVNIEGIPVISKKFRPIVDCSQDKNWIRKKQIGQGAYGKAYIICLAKDINDCDYVLKIQKADNEFMSEIKALAFFQNQKLICPKVYASWICNDEGFIIMEKLKKLECPDRYNEIMNIKTQKCVNKNSSEGKLITQNTYQSVKYRLDEIKKQGWLFIDIHSGNVMYRQKGKKSEIVLIDFGWAVQKGKKSYPNHALSKRTGKNFTYSNLELYQDIIFEQSYGYDRKKLDNLIVKADRLGI